MKTTAVCIVAMLMAGNLLAKIPLSQSFGTTDDFTIRLPAGWREIPKDVIDTQFKAMAELAPQLPRQTYDCGFQLDASSRWFQYPYILVQVQNTGRPPDFPLKSLSRVKGAI